MDSNTDLDKWRVLWQTDPSRKRPTVAELRDRVMRETRRKRMMLLAPMVVTVAIGGWMTARALGSGRVDDVVLAVEAWLFMAVIWTGSLWIDRGTWQPLGDSTGAFLELAIRRSESTLRAMRFGVFMYLIQLTAVLSWKVYSSGADPATLLRSWSAVVLGWIGLPFLIGLSVWYTRHKMTERHRLIALREEWRSE